ncbi:MAG: hypothetical protein KIT69_00025 [Propionibacteriaceae bacterium]|nr:hypothetical protein [Propionibacteriaceae bacterium]
MSGHHSLQAATRTWVEDQTGWALGYLEQLYTFIDLDREPGDGHRLSVSYLGLTTPTSDAQLPRTHQRSPGTRATPEPFRTPASGPSRSGIGAWSRIYDLLPWEDLREPGELPVPISTALASWAESDPASAEARRQRCAITFGLEGAGWQPDLVLQRYELMYEVGLVPEAPPGWRLPETDLAPGNRMLGDHRRVLATGLARLRSKIQYRPVVFELLPPQFTLRQLQDCVEALAGTAIHTQNFRRLVEQQRLVEETGGVDSSTGGRPARLYRFRREVRQQRDVAGTKLALPRVR